MENYDEKWLISLFEKNPDTKQKDLAEFIGLPASTMNKMVKGTRKIHITEAQQIIQYFGEEVWNDPEIVSLEHTNRIDANGKPSKSLGKWAIPKNAMPQLETHASDLKIITVESDSMYPILNVGDHVFVDTSAEAKTPSPSGLFLIWNGNGPDIRRLEIVAGDENEIHVSTPNSAYGSYHSKSDKLLILGRIRYTVKGV